MEAGALCSNHCSFCSAANGYPAAKRQKLDESIKIKDGERSIGFLLTSVREIPGDFNEKYIAVGIRGMFILIFNSAPFRRCIGIQLHKF